MQHAACSIGSEPTRPTTGKSSAEVLWFHDIRPCSTAPILILGTSVLKCCVPFFRGTE
eukprot:COSAG02_NODE_5767_length_4055_cov_2.085693_1_plen_57_part_10